MRVWRAFVPLPEASGRRDAAWRDPGLGTRTQGAGSGQPTPAVVGPWAWGGGAFGRRASGPGSCGGCWGAGCPWDRLGSCGGS
ncbi:hypothetical protein [Nonomuraea jabiensis]|uniref:Uncharacterized protein n=1 Tax=Nonomuraea jabiensis TaxID=882448 RepID=A0A7W9L8J2_9ACTN|nr:hypothetical protein [Nonomuraea jabiensis]MBB5774612.1 hypothetical protein [Nonomuraea jabiensis]